MAKRAVAESWPDELPELAPAAAPDPDSYAAVVPPLGGDDGYYEEAAGMRVFLYYVPYIDEHGIERRSIQGGDVATGRHTKQWRPPKAEPMVFYDFEDWHGSAVLMLRASLPEAEQERQLAVAKSIHGPHSIEACCVRRRENGGGHFVLADR